MADNDKNKDTAKEVDTVKEGFKILSNGWSKQIILYGPPGTSKTYSAAIIAAKLLLEKGKKATHELLQIKNKPSITHDDAEKVLKAYEGQYRMVQFHPAYTYEDFVRGITVKANGGNISYEVEAKVFETFCKDCNHETPKVLVIDEINRAPLSSVLGELIYGLEYRGKPISTPYALEKEGYTFTVPEDLYIIGTMNTADRSIGTIDYAVRRRFAFLPIGPNPECIAATWNNEAIGKAANNYYGNISEIFKKDSEYLKEGVDGEDIAIGHTYFLGPKDCSGKEEADLKKYLEDYLDFRMRYQVKPILEEYVKDGLLDESLTKSENWFDELLSPPERANDGS